MGDKEGEIEGFQILRELLLKPIYEQGKVRDQQLVKFVEQFGAKLTARLCALEQRVDQLVSEIDNRDDVVSDIGEGIATLAQQLRLLPPRPNAVRLWPHPGKLQQSKTASPSPRPRRLQWPKAIRSSLHPRKSQ